VAKSAWGRRARNESVEERFPPHATAKTNTTTVAIVIASRGRGELASSGVFHLSNELLGFFV
jgi:hypothetical protein